MAELVELFEKCSLKEKKESNSRKNLKEWVEKGNTLPNCINEGCKNIVEIRHWTSQKNPSLKTECSKCSGARKNKKLIAGITFHKKDYCENRDSILGFICPMDSTRYSEFPSDVYHMDHLDGNHTNNNRENLKTFCSICHTRKGKESGDFNSFKKSSYSRKEVN
jgi:hypothetical protein